MANAKISDTGVFLTGGVYNDITNINGLAGWSNNTGTNQNVAISGTQLVASLETNLYTTTPLPIAKGGTSIGPAPADPSGAGVLGVPFVGKLMADASIPIGDQLIIADDGTGASVLSTIPNSFSFLTIVNQAQANMGFDPPDWDQQPGPPPWKDNNTILQKYEPTATNTRVTKNLLKGYVNNFDIEVIVTLSGVATKQYNWRLILTDVGGAAPDFTLADSATIGATPSMLDFQTGGGTWGTGWQKELLTGIDATTFYNAVTGTPEVVLLIASQFGGGDSYANVGCSCRFMSPN